MRPVLFSGQRPTIQFGIDKKKLLPEGSSQPKQLGDGSQGSSTALTTTQPPGRLTREQQKALLNPPSSSTPLPTTSPPAAKGTSGKPVIVPPPPVKQNVLPAGKIEPLPDVIDVEPGLDGVFSVPGSLVPTTPQPAATKVPSTPAAPQPPNTQIARRQPTQPQPPQQPKDLVVRQPQALQRQQPSNQQLAPWEQGGPTQITIHNHHYQTPQAAGPSAIGNDWQDNPHIKAVFAIIASQQGNEVSESALKKQAKAAQVPENMVGTAISLLLGEGLIASRKPFVGGICYRLTEQGKQAIAPPPAQQAQQPHQSNIVADVMALEPKNKTLALKVLGLISSGHSSFQSIQNGVKSDWTLVQFEKPGSILEFLQTNGYITIENVNWFYSTNIQLTPKGQKLINQLHQ